MAQVRSALLGVARSIRYPMRHIRWKIIAPYAALTILLAIAGTYIVTRLVTGSLEERFNNRLAEAARVTSDSVVRRERQHLEVVRGVAFTEGVADATKSRKSAALENLVEPLAANGGAERVQVLNAEGERVLAIGLEDASSLTYEPLTDTVDPASWPIVQSVLEQNSDSLGDKFAQIVQTADGYALYTAGPIFDGDRLAGVVLVGSLLESFLPVAKGEALADITVYDFAGVPLATTFATEDSDGEDLGASPAALAQSEPSTVIRENRSLFGRDFELLYGELVVRDQVVGLYSVGLPSSFIFSARGSTRWQMALLFTAATAAVMLTGGLLARSLTRPLLRLVSTARAVTSGDLTARSGVRSEDEVGTLATSFDAMTERLQRQHLATVRALTSAIDARDPYTAGHSARVGHLAVEIGRYLELPDSQIQHLEIGGYLHDIGKIGIRDAILLKPGTLTPEEREMIRRHPRVGLDILASVELAQEVVDFVSGHHEKLNGTGYPRGRASDQLGIIPRIAAVADIYDALTTDRPYRDAMTVEEALEILNREADEGLIDGKIVATLERLLPRWERRRRTDPMLKGFRLPDVPLREAA